MDVFDYIVVGSGCSGAMAAQTLVDAGKRVVMLDVGEQNPDYESAVPNENFLDLRKKDADQYKYLIGKHGDGVVVNDSGKGAQITPTRTHLTRNTNRYIPLVSDTFTPIESLGYGGLGIGWGLQCWEFSPEEIAACGMNVGRMTEAYETISKRIGISATNDAAAPYTLGKLQTYQPSPKADTNMQKIQGKYLARKASFDRKGFYLGRTPLALLTKNKDGRKAYQYRDMDFYDDNGHSAWRPWMTVNELRKNPRFTYIPNFLALRVHEQDGVAHITGIHTETKEVITYKAKKLILATGALGTARVMLRSFGTNATKLPFLSNPYTYVPCVQPAMFGKAAERGKIGFGQLSAFLKKTSAELDDSILTLYSYQSLMLFRIIRQAPLNFSDARIIMQYLSSGLIVTGIQHSDKHTDEKYLQLTANEATFTGDELQASYKLNQEELTSQRERENRYLKAIRKLGLFPIRRMNPGHGSSVHYAGTLPFSETDKPLSLSPTGRAHGTKNIYVADSSGFSFLPARGLTFSILANAHITAQNVLNDEE